MSASGPVGRTWRDGENVRRGGGLARVRHRCKGQTHRRGTFPGRRTGGSDLAGVEGVFESVGVRGYLRGPGTFSWGSVLGRFANRPYRFVVMPKPPGPSRFRPHSGPGTN